MNLTENNLGHVLTSKELAKRIHFHEGANQPDQASQFKTGVLDVELLSDAGLHFEPYLLKCDIVSVKYAATTWSTISHKHESVFAVHDSLGRFHGHYFANAFSSLNR